MFHENISHILFFTSEMPLPLSNNSQKLKLPFDNHRLINSLVTTTKAGARPPLKGTKGPIFNVQSTH